MAKKAKPAPTAKKAAPSSKQASKSSSAELTLEEGRLLVSHARKSIERAVLGSPPSPLPHTPLFSRTRGIFVSLHTYPDHELRGCIGFPVAHEPLFALLPQAARACAIHDTRFSAVLPDELANLLVEVSVLTPPKPIPSEDAALREKAVRIGRDGLILQYGSSSAILLPQVAVEWNASPKQFLEMLCQKGGLPRDMWRSPTAQLFTFSAQVFVEEKPGTPAKLERLLP